MNNLKSLELECTTKIGINEDFVVSLLRTDPRLLLENKEYIFTDKQDQKVEWTVWIRTMKVNHALLLYI